MKRKRREFYIYFVCNVNKILHFYKCFQKDEGSKYFCRSHKNLFLYSSTTKYRTQKEWLLFKKIENNYYILIYKWQSNKIKEHGNDHFHSWGGHSIFRITHHPMKTQINLLIFCIQFYYHLSPNIRERCISRRVIRRHRNNDTNGLPLTRSNYFIIIINLHYYFAIWNP